MKKLNRWATVLSISAMTLAVAHAGNSTAKDARMDNIDFTPDLSVIQNGDFQYFYSLSDLNLKTGDISPNAADSFKNQANGLTEALNLDSEHILDSDLAKKSGSTYHIMILKWTTVVDKSVAFLQQHYPEADFQTNTHHDMKYVSKSAHQNLLQFKVEGTNAFVPNADCEIGIYDQDQISSLSDPGIQKILSMDSDLGHPSLVLTEHYSNFDKVMFSKTSKMGRAISKIYADPSDASKSIVVNYTMSYIYALPPGLIGGPDAIRSAGVDYVKDGMSYINELPTGN